MPPPAAIAVDARVAAPAELVACPKRPAPFPVDQVATMPSPVRDAAIGLATAYAGAVAQLERLIGWETGQSCARK